MFRREERLMDYHIVDADRHVSEPLSMWKEYLPRKYQDHAPYTVKRETDETLLSRMERLGVKGSIPLLPELFIKNEPVFNHWTEAVQIEVALQSVELDAHLHQATSPEAQIQSMDASRISSAFLFPTLATLIVNHAQVEPDVSVEYAKAYNNWLYDYCSARPQRLHGAGLISRHDPSQMVDELERVADFGWTCVVIRPEVILGRALGHADYESFWSHCEAMNIAIVFHGSTHLHGSTVGTDRFTTRFALAACSHPLEAQMAFLSLLEAGVLERHPRLKIAFLESGVSWLPGWLWRLDEICYKPMPGEVEQNITMPPSEYFKRQCWATFEPEEPCLREAINMVGADRLLFGTDFPHPDHINLVVELLEDDDSPLSPEELKLVLETNPNTFFGT